MPESDPAAERALARLRRLPENRVCPNCLKEERLGFMAVCMPFRTFVCCDCKSAHQSFSHRCKDAAQSAWQMAEVQQLDERNGGGNKAAQSRWLAGVPESERPSEGSSLDAFKRFVERAYIEERWAAPADAAPPAAAVASEPASAPALDVACPPEEDLPSPTPEDTTRHRRHRKDKSRRRHRSRHHASSEQQPPQSGTEEGWSSGWPSPSGSSWAAEAVTGMAPCPGWSSHGEPAMDPQWASAGFGSVRSVEAAVGLDYPGLECAAQGSLPLSCYSMARGPGSIAPSCYSAYPSSGGGYSPGPSVYTLPAGGVGAYPASSPHSNTTSYAPAPMLGPPPAPMAAPGWTNELAQTRCLADEGQRSGHPWLTGPCAPAPSGGGYATPASLPPRGCSGALLTPADDPFAPVGRGATAPTNFGMADAGTRAMQAPMMPACDATNPWADARDLLGPPRCEPASPSDLSPASEFLTGKRSSSCSTILPGSEPDGVWEFEATNPWAPVIDATNPWADDAWRPKAILPGPNQSMVAPSIFEPRKGPVLSF